MTAQTARRSPQGVTERSRSVGRMRRTQMLVVVAGAVAVAAGCASPVHGHPSHVTSAAIQSSTSSSVAPPSESAPTLPDEDTTTVPQAAAAGPQVQPGVYGCVVDSSAGMGGEASPGYNLVISAGNRYQSSLGTDQPGSIVFSDDTHFVFRGGFLDGDPGTYTPGTIDYHTPDRAALFGCYP